MSVFLTLAYLFFVGSVFGWVLELFFRKFFSSSNPEHKWINPGFCTGPYLPIYGRGLCVLYLLASLGERWSAGSSVGGKLLLYVSLIALDLGVFTATLLDTPGIYIILYLIGAHAFSGAINIMRALEARRYGGAWRVNAMQGAVGLLVALACVVFLRRTDILVYIYSAGLIYSAAMRIVTAFRRTAIVYIQ